MRYGVSYDPYLYLFSLFYLSPWNDESYSLLFFPYWCPLTLLTKFSIDIRGLQLTSSFAFVVDTDAHRLPPMTLLERYPTTNLTDNNFLRVHDQDPYLIYRIVRPFTFTVSDVNVYSLSLTVFLSLSLSLSGKVEKRPLTSTNHSMFLTIVRQQ